MHPEYGSQTDQPHPLGQLLFPGRAYLSHQWLEHRRLTGLSLFFLSLGGPLLWFWDKAIDPIGANETFWFRLAFALSGLVGWWQFRQDYRVWAPWVLVVWMLTTQALFLAILTRLGGGLGLGVSGLLFWTMAGMVMFQGSSIWINLFYTLLVFLIPLFVAAVGWLPGFEGKIYGLVIFPATLVGIVVQGTNSWNYLMRYHAEQRLEVLSNTDPLTGLLNRRAFSEAFNRLLSDQRRAKNPVAIIYFDIDHFKAVNDTYGHSSGDAVIQNLAQTCQSICRKGDLLARMGGEEFVMVFGVSDAEQASTIAERLRKTVEAGIVESEGNRIKYTISIGLLIEDRTASDADTMLKKADMALYRSKKEGRNRVVRVSR